MPVRLRPASSIATSGRPFYTRRCVTVASSVIAQPSKKLNHRSAKPTAQERGDFASVLALVQWAIANKIIFTGCRPDIRNGLRGVYAVSDIASGDNLVAVPLQSSLVVRPGEPCPFPDFLPQEVWATLPWYAQLALKLLNERCLGARSRFADYLPALPNRLDLPVLWPLSHRRALQYPYLEQQISDEEEEWDRLYGKLQRYLSRRHLTREDFRWALSCVRSRTFAGPYFPTPIGVKVAAGVVAAAAVALLTSYVLLGDGGALTAYLDTASITTSAAAAAAAVAAAGPGVPLWVFPAVAAAFGVPALWEAAEARAAQSGAPGTVFYAVCPFIDMFNHDSRSQNECLYLPGRGEFRVAAGSPAARGQQLLINYGNQSNDALLQRYGFVQLEGNPYDRYAFQDMQPRLEQAVRAVREAAGAGGRLGLEAVGQLRDGDLSALVQVALTPGEAVPSQTAAALTLLLTSASSGDVTAPISITGGAQAGETQPGDRIVTVGRLMAAVCREELRAAVSTLKEDEAALEQLAEWQVWQLAASEVGSGKTAAEEVVADEKECTEAVSARFIHPGEEAAGVLAIGHEREVEGLGETVSGGMVSGCVGQESGGREGEAESDGGSEQVLPPDELAVFGDEVSRFSTVLKFRIAKKRVLRQLVAQLDAGVLE